MLASSRLRRFIGQVKRVAIEARSVEHILDCGDDVRLQGFHTTQQALPQARGLVVLLHGWEGSVQSSYLLHTGARLLLEGFDVFRLHFRDHGDTHHLNEELFHSCRIAEVVGAVRAVAERFPESPLCVAGYSLGGNFALRVALHAPQAGVTLRHAVAVCPAISPRAVLSAIEAAPWFYERYFMLKWAGSLRRKQSLYPQRYTFSEGELRAGLRDLTRAMVERHTDFGTLENYLDGYSIADEHLAPLAVPVSILTAADDPIIPIEDFHRLALPPLARLDIAPYGGHCGFIRDFGLGSFAEDYVAARLLDACHGP
jgi:predicted alpha/beta-fold hydrolase